MKNFRKNSITKQKNKRGINYKAISIASLSTLALTLTLADFSKVQAMIGKAAGAGKTNTLVRNSGNLNINFGKTGLPGSKKPATFKSELKLHIGQNGSLHIDPYAGGVEVPGLKAPKAPTKTQSTIKTQGVDTHSVTGSTVSKKPAAAPIITQNHIGTQTDDVQPTNVAKTPSLGGSKISLVDDANEFDNVSLGSASTTSRGTLDVKADKKGLTNKQKLALGAAGLGAAGLAIGLGVGLGTNNNTTQETKGPDAVPVPKTPLNTNRVVTSGTGFYYTDEVANDVKEEIKDAVKDAVKDAAKDAAKTDK